MLLLSKTSEHHSYESHCDTAKVQLTPAELKLVRDYDRDTVDLMFETANCMPFVDVQGGQFIHTPSFHIEAGDVAVIHQWYGMDW